MDAATEASIDSNQDSNNEHRSGNEIEIIHSLSNLAAIVIRLQGVIDEERARSHSLLKENFELKSQRIAIDDQPSQAQKCHESLSNAHSKNKENNSTFKSKTKSSIIREVIHLEETREITVSRANVKSKLEKEKKQEKDQPQKTMNNNQISSETTKAAGKRTSGKKNNSSNNKSRVNNVSNDSQNQRMIENNGKYSSKIAAHGNKACEPTSQGRELPKFTRPKSTVICGDSMVTNIKGCNLKRRC